MDEETHLMSLIRDTLRGGKAAPASDLRLSVLWMRPDDGEEREGCGYGFTSPSIHHISTSGLPGGPKPAGAASVFSLLS